MICDAERLRCAFCGARPGQRCFSRPREASRLRNPKARAHWVRWQAVWIARIKQRARQAQGVTRLLLLMAARPRYPMGDRRNLAGL